MKGKRGANVQHDYTHTVCGKRSALVLSVDQMYMDLYLIFICSLFRGMMLSCSEAQETFKKKGKKSFLVVFPAGDTTAKIIISVFFSNGFHQ